jgi:hypothetical protein
MHDFTSRRYLCFHRDAHLLLRQPGKTGALPPQPPLRTGHDSFPSYGSSTPKADPVRGHPSTPCWQYTGLLCDTNLLSLYQCLAWGACISAHLLSPLRRFIRRFRNGAPGGRGRSFEPGDVSTRIHPITGCHLLLPPSQARIPISVPCGFTFLPYKQGRDTRFPCSVHSTA